MPFDSAKRQRLEFLIAIFEKAGRRAGVDANTKEAAESIGLDMDRVAPLGQYWLANGIIKYENFNWVSVSVEKLDEVEQLMEQSYREKENAIHSRLVELDSEINSLQLALSLSIPKDDVDTILLDFKNKGWVHVSFGLTAKISPAGKTAFHRLNEDKPTPPASIVYNIQNSGNNNQFGGEGNVINIQQTNNPDFDKAIQSIIELIKSSSLSNEDKHEAIAEVQAINKFALEPPANAFERVKLKITAVETVVKATELATKLAPYWPMVISFFESLDK